MTRPRRPILATACAALLLAAAAVWVTSYLRRDSLLWDFRDGVEWNVSYGLGEVSASRSGPWPGGLQGEGLSIDENEVRQADPAKFHPLWFHAEGASYRIGPARVPVWEASAPIWFVTLVPAAGLWWCWRGRKVGLGFPVEPARGESA